MAGRYPEEGISQLAKRLGVTKGAVFPVSLQTFLPSMKEVLIFTESMDSLNAAGSEKQHVKKDFTLTQYGCRNCMNEFIKNDNQKDLILLLSVFRK